MPSNIFWKVWNAFSLVFLLTLLYFLINDWKYNTYFLPVLEGALSLAAALVVSFVYFAARATKLQQYSKVPWLIVLFCVLVGSLGTSFGLNALVGSSLFFMGALGLPLGFVVATLHPLLDKLPELAQVIFLVIPVLISVCNIVSLYSFRKLQLSVVHFLVNFVMPVVVLIIFAMLASFYVGSQKLLELENNRSYQEGREMQEVLESFYRENNYFPETLEVLVEKKYIDTLPVSVVNNTLYSYKADKNLQNYTICFPRHGEEVCQRSWSR